MNGKPFQSKLSPHFELIAELRRKGRSWQEITNQLKTLGITTDKGSVCAFFKRHRRRPVPMGMEIKTPTSRQFLPQEPIPKKPPLTETELSDSEFGPDPLTMSTKSKWGIVPAK